MTNEAGLEFEDLKKERRATTQALGYLDNMRLSCIESGKDRRLINRMANHIKKQIEKGRV